MAEVATVRVVAAGTARASSGWVVEVVRGSAEAATGSVAAAMGPEASGPEEEAVKALANQGWAAEAEETRAVGMAVEMAAVRMVVVVMVEEVMVMVEVEKEAVAQRADGAIVVVSGAKEHELHRHNLPTMVVRVNARPRR